MEAATTQAIEGLSQRWNEPEIANASLLHWLEQFEPGDHPSALQLLDCMEMHGWARLIRECRLLHERLCTDLKAEGFDVEHFTDIDFSRAFVCKSGDLIAYVYRKANRIPVSCFHNIEALHSASTGRHERRALVLFDDYIGTGSQFLFQFVARSDTNRALLQRYQRIRLAAIVVHDNAREKWKLLQHHQHQRVMEIEERQLTCMDFSSDRDALTQALSELDWRRAALVAVQRDFPVTAHPKLSPEQRRQLSQFLRTLQQAEGAGTTEFLLGHHTFFYGAPNALARVLLPLFKRIEDFTVYPKEAQVGLPADILDYDIDNPDSVTPFGLRNGASS